MGNSDYGTTHTYTGLGKRSPLCVYERERKSERERERDREREREKERESADRTARATASRAWFRG